MIEQDGVIILGGGGHASVLAELLRALNKTIIGFVAPHKSEIRNYPEIRYLGNDSSISEHYSAEKILLVNGLGSVSVQQNEVRHQLFNAFKAQGYRFTVLAHPSAWVASTAILKEGCQVMAGAVIQPNVVVNENAIVNTSASIDHDCIIGHSVHVAPGVVMSGNISLGEKTHVGVGSTIIQGITIGSHAVICAGTVVTKDVQAYEKFKEYT